MSNATQPRRQITPTVAASKERGKFLSWKDFQRRYRNLEDGNKYEWVNERVEKTPRSMDQRQLFVQRNLNRFLRVLQNADPTIGEFSVETDTFLSEFIHHKPDIAYFGTAQILAAAKGELQIPLFVIEVISPTRTSTA